jgi:hypothetical protein
MVTAEYGRLERSRHNQFTPLPDPATPSPHPHLLRLHRCSSDPRVGFVGRRFFGATIGHHVDSGMIDAQTAPRREIVRHQLSLISKSGVAAQNGGGRERPVVGRRRPLLRRWYVMARNGVLVGLRRSVEKRDVGVRQRGYWRLFCSAQLLRLMRVAPPSILSEPNTRMIAARADGGRSRNQFPNITALSSVGRSCRISHRRALTSPSRSGASPRHSCIIVATAGSSSAISASSSRGISCA